MPLSLISDVAPQGTSVYVPKDRDRAMTEAIIMVLLQRARNLGAHIPDGTERWQYTREGSLVVGKGSFIVCSSEAEFWLTYWALLLLYREQQGSEWGKRGGLWHI